MRAHARGLPSRARACALVMGLSVLALVLTPCPVARAGEPGRVTDLQTWPLQGVPGKEVAMFTVVYEPGGTDPVHRHDASAFVYVLEGTIEMQIAGGEKVTLRPGQIFYEPPDGIHLVSRNPSDTEPARFLVVLVKNEGAPLLVPVER